MGDLAPCGSLTIPLRLPVRIWQVQGLPKIMAAGVPVIPLNVALKERGKNGATECSLNTYACAAKLYVEFAALLHRSLIGVTDDEYDLFKGALLGKPFSDPDGNLVRLSGERANRTADNRLVLIESLASDIERLYRVRFEWRKVQEFELDLIEVLKAAGNYTSIKSIRHKRGIKWRARKTMSLPDDQFIKLLQGAYDLWGRSISDGDRAYAKDPEAQLGALFYRNSAILLIARYDGTRRSEITTIELADIDRQAGLLYLVTKGHGGPDGEKLPVPLFPAIYDIIWFYVTRFRPVVSGSNAKERQTVFLSHSPANYGQPITNQTINEIVKVLRKYLDPPWNRIFKLHMLRHSYAHDLEKHVSEAGVVTGMRHASSRSLEPYRGSIQVHAEEIVQALRGNIGNMLSEAGLLVGLG